MSETKRASVSERDFVRVVIVERDQFDTVEKAANELGLTIASFRQRLTRERKRYPELFENVPSYSRGTRIKSLDEMQSILAELTTDETSEYEDVE
jgi:hypothetical protein